MSKFDENLFSRIALYNEYVSQEQLDECLRLKEETGSRSLGEILLERGYLDSAQLDSILRVRRKKIRKYLRNPREARESDKGFGQLAVGGGHIDTEDLEAALLEQERLARLNLHFRLGEILVARDCMGVETVLEILGRQGKRIFCCPTCDCHYNVVEYDDGRDYRCLKCESVLTKPNYLDTVAVDALL